MDLIDWINWRQKMKDNFFDGLEDAKESIKTRFVNCGREANDLEKGCPYCDNLRNIIQKNLI